MIESSRVTITDGPHTTEVLKVLAPDLKPAGIASALKKATEIIRLSVDPIAGPPAEPSDGLLYGLIQSGKTSILTVSAAMAVDNGFDCLLVLTSDNDLLYEQTIDRVRAALRGLTILGKKDWRDSARFAKQVRTKPFGIVCSKNGRVLSSLLEAFRFAKTKGLSIFMVDDEADQASLNTFASKADGTVSTINQVITEFRSYFPVNTYLQVTATPQALFLQRPGHAYRPTFTVVTEPGEGYVGGNAFFGDDREHLMRLVDISEITQLQATRQPSPSGQLPPGLKTALHCFFVAAGAKVLERPGDGFAFLLHTSMSNRDHEYTQRLFDAFKEDAIRTLKDRATGKFTTLRTSLRVAYDDLATTKSDLPSFDNILERITFYLPGCNIKLVNATSSDEIKLDSVFNLFIGGNKLGRGVTIKNLLVSYYGRNPRTPRADTVLQHARMYGYRKRDVDVTRLFLPERLADHFTAMHEMESSLRELLRKHPLGFEGIYISGSWTATRSNVLDPNTIGYYEAGLSYNPEQPLRSVANVVQVSELDTILSDFPDAPPYQAVTVDFALSLMSKVRLDPVYKSQFWDLKALETALRTVTEKQKEKDKVYLVVRRERNLKGSRGERKGIISGGDESFAPHDCPILFFYRQNSVGPDKREAWWPQLRFSDGNYVLAFSFDW